MKFHTFFLSSTLTLATIVSAHTPAFSQEFKNPTRPRLPEITPARTQAPQPPISLTQAMSQPLQLNNGQTFFSAAPRLVRAATSQKASDAPSTYEFTLTVPANAGQPLKAVTIAQSENLETVQFDTSRSKAFTGDRDAVGSVIGLTSIGGTNSKAVTIAFDQPVQPGSTVTIALEAKANPRFGGVYEFGVTAYPAGENGLGQFLGFGRLSYANGQ